MLMKINVFTLCDNNIFGTEMPHFMECENGNVVYHRHESSKLIIVCSAQVLKILKIQHRTIHIMY